MRPQLLAMTFTLAACTFPSFPAERSQGSGVDGSESDVRTPLGASGEHEIGSCTQLGKGRLVRGLGTAGYRGVALDDKTSAREGAVNALLSEKLRPALVDVHSVWGTGVGLSCVMGAPVGAVIDLSSWHDVDPVIAIVSGILDSEHLGEIVSIEVEGIPVADVGG